MPQNKRESLIYTTIMCFLMVLWMSVYNVTLHTGSFSLETIKIAWLGFPIAYIVAICCDWFLVSRMAKGFAFRFLVNHDSHAVKKVVVISSCMVIPMVLLMSLYGGLELCIRSGEWDLLPMLWLTNIPKNFVMALPFQLLMAGPVVRTVFRKAFPVGTVLG